MPRSLQCRALHFDFLLDRHACAHLYPEARVFVSHPNDIFAFVDKLRSFVGRRRDDDVTDSLDQ